MVISTDLDPQLCSNVSLQDKSELYVPECSDELKPRVGQCFRTLEQGIEFYRVYGGVCGFDIRLSTVTKADGVVMLRYIFCNREGKSSSSLSGGCKRKRKRMSVRFNCMARVVFKYSGSQSYVITLFNEGHSHPLVSDGYKQFLKVNRRLTYGHQSFVLTCLRSNIGPMKSFRLFKELVGSYENVGCSANDFRNFTRDLHAHVLGADAQILLNNLERKKEFCPGFCYYFDIDHENKLKRLFWADKFSIESYNMFGDAVSFDATYSTNKYNLIFTPFTGKDNHGKCVTFAAGLLSNEDVDSYTWLFEKFVDCMGEKRPSLLITDQDPAIKIAVSKIFPLPTTRHRFCMWHIMLKVADKISSSLREDEVFCKKFNALVWSEVVEPTDFEDQWYEIIDEFDLSDNNWFSAMFDLRFFWIPAYFKDLALGGLFHTTSMSESENSFFRKYLSRHANLIEFFMHFGSALGSQRHVHKQLSSVDESSFPKLETKLPLERHAASFYTFHVFYEVQKEIVGAVNHCCMLNMKCEDNFKTFEVSDLVLGKFTVVHDMLDDSVKCSCNRFLTKGLLCQHMFFILKNMGVQRIPDVYLLRRWSKTACSEFVKFGDTSSYASSHHDQQSHLNSQLYSEVYKCLGLVTGNVNLMADLLQDFKDLSEKYSKACQSSSSSVAGKEKVFDNFYGCTVPDSISVHPPDPVKTKGSGSRFLSRKEAARRKASKPKRRCSNCKEMANHDARNCDREKK